MLFFFQCWLNLSGISVVGDIYFNSSRRLECKVLTVIIVLIPVEKQITDRNLNLDQGHLCDNKSHMQMQWNMVDNHKKNNTDNLTTRICLKGNYYLSNKDSIMIDQAHRKADKMVDKNINIRMTKPGEETKNVILIPVGFF